MSHRFARDWLPPVVYRSLRRAAAEARYLFYARKDILEKNRTLKGLGEGRRAFLLATGPSVSQENLKLLEGEDCFTVSNAFLHDDIQAVNPAFHGFAPHHPPLSLANYVEWLVLADSMLPAQTKIVLGHRATDIVDKYGLFPEREVHYLYLGAGRRHVDLTRPVLGPQTGPILLLPLMIYMGYKQIYLLGCDCTPLRDYGRTVRNFYRSDRDIRKDTTASNFWSDVETEIRATLVVFDQYRYHREILSGTSTRIVNLSADSWLEVFPFDRLEHIVRP
jgi:hypothetical protein